MKEGSRSVSGDWLIYSFLYSSHFCLRWWVKMLHVKSCMWRVIYLFWKEEKKRKIRCSGSWVSWVFIYVLLLVIRVNAGRWILVWLMEVACELGWHTFDESPIVQEILLSLPQMARASLHLASPFETLLEGWCLFMMWWAPWDLISTDRR